MRKKQRVIVTGGAGFIGSHIARRLLAQGYKVAVIDNLSTGKEENIPKEAEFIKLDLGKNSSYEAINGISCDAIFHLAGQSSGEASFKDPYYDFCSHALSTFRLLEYAKRKKVARFMYASSMSVYGDPCYLPVNEAHPLNPRSFYAAAKISAEGYIKLYQSLGMNTTIFRMFSVYGPGQNLENKMQGMLSIYLSYFLEKTPVVIKGSEERFRDFVYIDDVVEAWFKSLEEPISYGKIYNLASGEKTKVKYLISSLKKYFKTADYTVKHEEGTPGDQFGVVADISLIKKELAWEPKIGLKAGIRKTIDFQLEKIGK